MTECDPVQRLLGILLADGPMSYEDARTAFHESIRVRAEADMAFRALVHDCCAANLVVCDPDPKDSRPTPAIQALRLTSLGRRRALG